MALAILLLFNHIRHNLYDLNRLIRKKEEEEENEITMVSELRVTTCMLEDGETLFKTMGGYKENKVTIIIINITGVLSNPLAFLYNTNCIDTF